MNSYYSIFILLLIFSQGSAQNKQLIDKTIAIVGDKVILYSDIELQYQQLALDGNVSPDIKCDILEQLLVEKMYLMQAQLDSVEVTEDEIEGELDRRIRYFVAQIGSVSKLEEFYGKSILEIKDEFRKDIENQILSEKMQAKVTETVEVTPKEVREFFESIPKDSLPYFNAEFEISQIVIKPKISSLQKQMALEKIEELRNRILKGEDFGILAQSYSQDPGSAAQNGDLGYFSRGQMVPEFEGYAFKLEKGQVSEVFQTEYGYHILKVLDRKGESVRAAHLLIKPEITSGDYQETYNKLESIRKFIVSDSISFQKAVARFSEDEASKNSGGLITNPTSGNTFFEVSQMDKDLYFTIEKLKIGDISSPNFFTLPDGSPAGRIIMLISETKPHAANLEDDYYRIKAAAQAEKEQRYIAEWVSNKIKETYVSLDQAFRFCPQANKWYKKDQTIEKSYD